LTWRSYATEIRDEYGLAPGVPNELREMVIEAHALGHRMLRIIEAARARTADDVDSLYTEWGRRYFAGLAASDDQLLAECVRASGLDADLLDAADDKRWDAPIVDAMETAYRFGGPKTQTPVIVIYDNPPHGFKGPVMSVAPTGDDAIRLWDALQVLSKERGFFEITRPRTSPPRPPTRPAVTAG
jgi:hypothetical protein